MPRDSRVKRAETCHREAMRLADQAFRARTRGDGAHAAELLQQAYNREGLAASLVSPDGDLEPSRSVLHRSAASLALQCGDVDGAERLSQTALSGSPPEEIKRELLELLVQVQFAKYVEDAEPSAPDTLRRVVLPPVHKGAGRLFLYRFVKRVMDVVGALAGLIITLPLYPFIALAIKLDSSGPVFFLHRRQTLGGREFGCLKFRTMTQDADILTRQMLDDADDPDFSIEEDPRLTRVGRFLRRTNLDEVPQFWNVLLGHMSLVGPAPASEEENQFCPAWRETRLSVPAGLTGAWQVCRAEKKGGDFLEWIRSDTQYVRHLSLWNDLMLIGRSIRLLFRSREARSQTESRSRWLHLKLQADRWRRGGTLGRTG
jgi:lipopolysaccharide/colanic/teichoic acid biosynthesis glycosyltransferase